MDIVKSNFNAQSEEFFKDIKKTEFLAMDLEFTGIKTDEKTTRADTCIQRYKKSYQVAKRYQIIQIGISKFVKTGEDKYDCSTYNFYVFPSSFNERFDSHFKCDVSTIEFLVKCNSIDFNKWLNEGVAYFNKDQMQKIQKSLSYDTIQDIIDNGIKRPTEFHYQEEKEQAMQDWKEVKEWILNNNSEDSFIYQRELFSFKKFLLENFLSEFKDQKENFFFSENYCGFTQKRLLKIQKVTAEQLELKKNQKKALIQDEIDSTRGFGKFWEKLVDNIQQYNIPVIGHNMYLDLLFICNHFQSFLSENYMEYKKCLKEMFPVIYDTKILQQFLDIKTGQNLEQNYNQFKQKHQIQIVDKNQSLNTGVAHNAGYDAFMTGACFLYFSKELDKNKYENLIKLYGHPYIAMQNNGSEKDVQLLKHIYVLGFKQKQVEKNMKINIQKIFKENSKLKNFELNISEKRLSSNKNNSYYMLYFENQKDLTKDEQKQFVQILQKIQNKFKDLIEYEAYNNLVLDEMKTAEQIENNQYNFQQQNQFKIKK